MIQHCIVGYFHSGKEYPGVERKPSNRSALVGWSIKRPLFKPGPNYREPFHNNIYTTRSSGEKMPSFFSNI